MFLLPFLSFCAVVLLTLLSPVLGAQTAPRMQANPPRRVVSIDPAANARAAAVQSPTIHPDGTVTFRYVDRTAKAVEVFVEGNADNFPMTRDADGVWTYTTQPLPPEWYGYRFVVDDEKPMDPRNGLIRPNLINPSNVAHVPGNPPAPWDLTNVPHGEVHHHFYVTKVATDEDGLHDRDLYVYTPPGYDPKRKKPYPVLYLLHGYSDNAEGWTAAGEANYILDNMLAQGKIEPMVVVMPRAYGTMRMITDTGSVWTAPFARPLENQRLFTDMMLQEILPLAEANYDVAHDAAHRAIAGLSMGGGESITTGLNHPEIFGYVGAFSSAIVSAQTPVNHPKPEEIDDATYERAFTGIVPHAKTQPAVKLFWISCGTEDGLITVNRKFEAWAKTNVKGNVSANETPGMHTWLVWRENLITFSQLLWK